MTHQTTDKILAIGLMSGTSVDGIDAALVEICDRQGILTTNLIAGHTYEYDADLRKEILAVCAGEPRSLQQICELDDRIAESFAKAALAIREKSDRQPDLIGSHGQTVFHRPPTGQKMGYTVQLGRGAVIAELTEIKTVSDFRVADIEAGGHAAPLVPMLDILLLSHPEKYRVCQNIGGISNLTYLPPKALENQEKVFGFDNGSGNVLMDMAAQKLFGVPFDNDGAIARQGEPNLELINNWLEQEFFLIPPPKSTGRELFSPAYLEQCLSECKNLNQSLSDYDILATLTEFTARAIAQSYHDFLPVFPEEVLVGGGGGRNGYLMERLQDLLKPAIVKRTDDFGLSGDSKEAIAFAVLGYLRIKERYGNLPSVTGAKRSVLLGKIYQ
ncbi:anhydro-N-acetylmuramic acid kinase [Pseudanabaena sp. ABRG5-3]|uniref:anhydro-N-acetylmuramic acid kinase n=1 Tax=Pseudanabaena sp. ABRG5-3 TaxID=685565 RepID=UPI0021F18D51|nr:anhydro-N-acetylmuramic acid kinase [Pseudanabaena sp. ABRG5-3]